MRGLNGLSSNMFFRLNFSASSASSEPPFDWLPSLSHHSRVAPQETRHPGGKAGGIARRERGPALWEENGKEEGSLILVVLSV
jgi:hypothetical protein